MRKAGRISPWPSPNASFFAKKGPSLKSLKEHSKRKALGSNPCRSGGGLIRLSSRRDIASTMVSRSFRQRRSDMPTNRERDEKSGEGELPTNTPRIVSEPDWEAARQELLVKEKALTRARDALAAERRRMPWMAVEKKYE